MKLDTLAENLEHTLPDLGSIRPLRWLGEGFGSYVVETAGGIVFRIARVVEAGQAYTRERQVLPLLHENLPLAIPAPHYYVKPGGAFPFGAIGYPKLPGQPVDPDRLNPAQAQHLADQIGALIAAIQRVPISRLPLVDDFEDRKAGWVRMRDQSLPVLQAVLQADELNRVAAWWDTFLSDRHMHTYTPVLQHGDLWYGNLLVESNRLVGLLDFQEVGLGDPVLDFVPQLYLGRRFLEWVLAGFENAGGDIVPDFWHRLYHLWALREFGGLSYAIQHNDRSELTDTVEKIRKGPILSPAGINGWKRFEVN